MNKANEATTHKRTKKKKPLYRAKHWVRGVPRMALKLAGLMLAIAVLGLILSALQAVESLALRVALSALIALGMLLMCFNEGITRGAADVSASRLYAERQAKGIALSHADDAACYRVIKAVCACAAVFAVPLALSLYVAVNSKGYTYSMQDLPQWLTQSYGMRSDVMAPLGAYAQLQSAQAIDWIRALVRLPAMIFINFFSDPLVMSGTVDKAVPAFLLTYPAMYLIGYLFAPRMQSRRDKMNRRAKKVAVRKAQKKSLVEELVGDQHGVHYGHRNEEGKHKKKELV